jgi:hypothetical protein
MIGEMRLRFSFKDLQPGSLRLRLRIPTGIIERFYPNILII